MFGKRFWPFFLLALVTAALLLLCSPQGSTSRALATPTDCEGVKFEVKAGNFEGAKKELEKNYAPMYCAYYLAEHYYEQAEDEKAREWIERSRSKGLPDSQFKLQIFYLTLLLRGETFSLQDEAEYWDLSSGMPELADRLNAKIEERYEEFVVDYRDDPWRKLCLRLPKFWKDKVVVAINVQSICERVTVWQRWRGDPTTDRTILTDLQSSLEALASEGVPGATRRAEAIQNYIYYLDLMSDGPKEATVSDLEKASKHLNSANEGLAKLNIPGHFPDTHGAQDSLVGARARASVEAVMRGDKEIPDYDTLDHWVNSKALNLSYRKVVKALSYYDSCRRDDSPDAWSCIRFMNKLKKLEAKSVFQNVLGAEDYFFDAKSKARKTITAQATTTVKQLLDFYSGDRESHIVGRKQARAILHSFNETGQSAYLNEEGQHDLKRVRGIKKNLKNLLAVPARPNIEYATIIWNAVVYLQQHSPNTLSMFSPKIKRLAACVTAAKALRDETRQYSRDLETAEDSEVFESRYQLRDAMTTQLGKMGKHRSYCWEKERVTVREKSDLGFNSSRQGGGSLPDSSRQKTRKEPGRARELFEYWIEPLSRTYFEMRLRYASAYFQPASMREPASSKTLIQAFVNGERWLGELIDEEMIPVRGLDGGLAVEYAERKRSLYTCLLDKVSNPKWDCSAYYDDINKFPNYDYFSVERLAIDSIFYGGEKLRIAWHWPVDEISKISDLNTAVTQSLGEHQEDRLDDANESGNLPQAKQINSGKGSPEPENDDLVLRIQKKLAALGYELIPDGKSGPKTISSIQDYQLWRGLDKTGQATEGLYEYLVRTEDRLQQQLPPPMQEILCGIFSRSVERPRFCP